VPLLVLFLGSIFKFNLELGCEEGTKLEATLHHLSLETTSKEGQQRFYLGPSNLRA
jgi:hypothetical protein